MASRQKGMKVIVVMVETLDGRTTDGDIPGSSWSSAEDHAYFSKTLKEHRLIIMGRTTYDAASTMMQHTPDRLRVVLTSRPEKYQDKARKDQLEFTASPPRELLKDLAKRGYEEALL